MWKVLLLSHFNRLENEGTESLSNLPKVTELVSDRASICIQMFPFWGPCLESLCYTASQKWNESTGIKIQMYRIPTFCPLVLLWRDSNPKQGRGTVVLSSLGLCIFGHLFNSHCPNCFHIFILFLLGLSVATRTINLSQLNRLQPPDFNQYHSSENSIFRQGHCSTTTVYASLPTESSSHRSKPKFDHCPEVK